MQKIRIICGAGVSSTFLASRMRAIATQRGFDWEIEPVSESDLPRALSGANLMLVGSHLSGHFATIDAEAEREGVPALLLSPESLSTTGVAEVVDLVQATLRVASLPAQKSGEPQ